MEGEHIHLQLSRSFYGYNSPQAWNEAHIGNEQLFSIRLQKNQKKAGDSSIFLHTGMMRGRQGDYTTKKSNFISLSE